MNRIIKGLFSILLILLINANLFPQTSRIRQSQLMGQDTTSYIKIGFGSIESYPSVIDSSVIIRMDFKQVKEYDKIIYLGIHNVPIDTIISILPYFSDVVQVSWNDKSITELPDAFFTLKSIKFACFFLPEMANFPEKIYLLSKLEMLCINKTKIETIPESIGLLSNLKDLDLTENEIRDISPAIGKLKKLQFIDLSHNNLRLLPNTFVNLGNLRVINLDENKLEKLPEPFINLKKIQHLSMRNNKLTYLPKDFGKFPNDKVRIEWFNNPWNEKDLKLLKTYMPYSSIINQ